MKKTGKAVISFLLALAMLIGLAPIVTLSAAAENAEFRPIWPFDYSATSNSLNCKRITSLDYYLNDEQNDWGSLHKGIDIRAEIGTPVKAVADGKVVFVGDFCDHNTAKSGDKTSSNYYKNDTCGSSSGYAGCGNLIVIEHEINGKTFYSVYMHLTKNSHNAYNVDTGSYVKQGDPIAKSGSTGWSTGGHLHLELMEGVLKPYSAAKLHALRESAGPNSFQYYLDNVGSIIGVSVWEKKVMYSKYYKDSIPLIASSYYDTDGDKIYLFSCDHSAGYETKQKADGTWAAFCKECNREYILPELNTETAGVYKYNKLNPTDSNSNGIGDAPYSNACNACGVEGAEVTITGSVSNAYGNIWYKTADKKWIYSGYLTFVRALPAPSDKITLGDDFAKPVNLVEGGDGLTLHGTITSEYSNLSYVSVGIYNSAGTSVQNGYFKEVTGINGKTYDINKLDQYLGFNHLTAGTYRYIVRAKNAANPDGVTLYNESFTVAGQNVVYVTSVSLNKSAASLVVGASETLTASVLPANATNKAITWTSSNTAVATVDTSGKVTAKAAGTATITAKTVDQGKTAACVVTVTAPTQTEETGEYKTWKLSDARWANVKLGSSNTTVANSVGCHAAAAQLIVQAGLKKSSEFNIWTYTTWLNNNSGFYSNLASYYQDKSNDFGLMWDKDDKYVSGFEYDSSKGNKYSSESANSALLSAIKNGVHVMICIDNYGGSDYWVAVDESMTLATNTIYVFHTKSTGATEVKLKDVAQSFSTAHKYTGGTTARPTTYTVTYNANGGTGAPAAQTKTHGTALTLSSVKPSRKSDSAGNYTVTLNANGGSVSQNTVAAAKTINYSFKNWNTASNGSGTSYNAGASYTANAVVTLYAQWTSSTSVSQVTLPMPTRTGYTFKGWGTTANATTGTTGSYTPQSDVTLYAVWQANTYTVTYNANGGTGAPAAQTKTHGTALTLSTTKPSKISSDASSYVVTLNANGGTCSAASIEATRLTDYSFKNWNTKADGTGSAYSSGASYTTDASATLYAQWSSTTKTKSVTLPTPVRSGYTFLGWEESGNSSARFTESYTPGGNVTLNAVWQDNTFSVDINGWLDGAMAGNIAEYGTVDVWINGEKVADDVTDYSAKWPAGTSYEVKDIKATQGHAYVGVADGTLSGTVGEGYTGIRLSFSTQYTVSFDANGGDVSTANKTVLLGGKYGTLPVPSREGYRFTGWYSENVLITASTVVSKDAATALTAHWEAISAEEVHLNKTTAELVVGDKVILEATITPADALNKTVTWSSSDNSVATVNQTNGEVTAVGAGTATITATAADGSRVSASCRIVVKKSLNSYTVSFDANGGSAAPDPLTKTEGTAIVLPAAIPERNGYTFLGWSESDAATVADYAAGGSLNKDADIVLYAIWKKSDVPADAAELVIESVVARAGDTVKVTYVLKNSCELKSIALFNLTYNSDALELVSGEWKVTDTVLQNWNSTTTNGAVAFDENSKVDGEIFAATFKVKDGTGDGDYRISCDITAKTRTEMGTEEAVEIVTVDGGVTVISYISGDVDDDGNVTSDDAIYVLYYTLLPDMYPVNQPVDFDGDGQITSDDAIYLLYYTLLPDLYPLS